MNPLKLSPLLFCLLFAQPVLALRCGNKLVDLGEQKQEIVDKCGDPETIDTHIERRMASNYSGGNSGSNQSSIVYGQQNYVEIDVNVEEWVYNFGPRRFRQSLRFENGRLTDIKDLDYGD